MWSDTTYFKGGDEFLLRLLFLINSILWSPDLSPIIGKTKFSAKFFLYVYWGTAFFGLGGCTQYPRAWFKRFYSFSERLATQSTRFSEPKFGFFQFFGTFSREMPLKKYF